MLPTLLIWVFVSFCRRYRSSAYLLDSLSDVLPTDAMIPFYAGLRTNGKETRPCITVSRTIGISCRTSSCCRYLSPFGKGVFCQTNVHRSVWAFEKVREIAPITTWFCMMCHYPRRIQPKPKTALSYYQQF